MNTQVVVKRACIGVSILVFALAAFGHGDIAGLHSIPLGLGIFAAGFIW